MSTTTTTSTTDEGYTPAYGLPNSWRDTRRRLRLLESLLDPATNRHLDALGVGPGWDCLEVGGGGGSIARSLCQRVGPEGHVLAVDLDTRFLEEIAAENLAVRRVDVVADPLPEAACDLVHARAVLAHLRERETVLTALVGALRPGGWLLVEDGDSLATGSVSSCWRFPVRAIGTGAWRRVGDVICRPLTAAGFDEAWARRLPEVLCGAGLVDVGAVTEVRVFRGGSPGAEFFDLSWCQLAETNEFTPAERAELEAARAELADPGRWFHSWAVVSAWGRRPVA